MRVKFCIERYGSYEFRTADIDLVSACKEEMEGTVSSCGGYEDDALDSIQIEESETAQMFIKDYM